MEKDFVSQGAHQNTPRLNNQATLIKAICGLQFSLYIYLLWLNFTLAFTLVMKALARIIILLAVAMRADKRLTRL